MTEVLSNKELKDKIILGVTKLNDAVSSTLGPHGRTVLIRNREGKLIATKDGVSVAKAFDELEDQGENAGVQLLQEVAINAARTVGDGTTTSTLLAYTMIKEGFSLIENGSNPAYIKKGMDIAVQQVIEGLKGISIDITEQSQIKEVATISGNNDEEIGTLISTALDKVGREGIVSIEKSKSGETSLDVVEGMQFDRGYKSPYFVTDNDKMNAVLDEPLILIFNGRLTLAKDILPVMQYASNTKNKTLLIVAEDIEGEALSTLVVNKMRGIVNSVAVKAPDFGDRRTAILEDLAVITGGTVISVDKGHRLEKLTTLQLEEFLGEARTVTITKDKTTIIDGNCSEEDVVKRANEIKTQLDGDISPFEKEKLQERLGRMVGGVAVISVGGNSEIEITEKRDRVEDALFAAQSSFEEGIVPGGGTALLYARESITFNKDENDINLGKKIIYKACGAPFSKILTNSGMDEVETLILAKTIIKSKTKWDGYNIKKEKISNMKEDGILDPLKVARLAIINSNSVAGTLLTTSTLVFEKREDIKEEQQY